MASEEHKEAGEEEGGADPAESVEGRPAMPMTEGLKLGQALTRTQEFALDAALLFGQVPLFASLSAGEIEEIVKIARYEALLAGDVLFAQGDEAQSMYLVRAGEVQVRAAAETGEEVVLAVLGSGTVVGELALIAGGPRSATVEAIEDCEVFRIERGDFERLRGEQRPAAYKIILSLAATVDARRRQAESRIQEVFNDPEQHIDVFQGQVHELLARLRKV
jgi:CRP-like cAMP-binding protein